MAGKLSIVMFSGTADKFIPLGVISQAAAAMGMQVNVFVTGFALLGFTKKKNELPFPAEFKDMAPKLIEGMKKNNVQPWDAMLAEAKKLGAKIYACSMMAGAIGLHKEDFGPLIDGIVGAATFIGMAEGGEVLFIRGVSAAGNRKIVDSRGRLCPGPITDLALAYMEAKVGDIIELWATDPGVKSDVHAWAQRTGNKILSIDEGKGKITVIIQITKR